MKYIRQFAIIALISLAGEILNHVLPFPVPSSIYGILILLVLLSCGMLKVSQIKDVSSFLIEIMPVMFIPAAVGLIEIITDMKGALLPVAGVIVLTTIIVMGATGRTAQWIIEREAGKKR